MQRSRYRHSASTLLCESAGRTGEGFYQYCLSRLQHCVIGEYLCVELLGCAHEDVLIAEHATLQTDHISGALREPPDEHGSNQTRHLTYSLVIYCVSH